MHCGPGLFHPATSVVQYNEFSRKVETRMARPTLKMYLDPDEYRAGETVRGHVQVDVSKAVRTRGVRVYLEGTEKTVITESRGTGKNRRTVTYSETNMIISEGYVLFGGQAVGTLKAIGETLSGGASRYPLLKAGRHRWPFEFKLPDDALPSFKGVYTKVRYGISAEVDIPAGLDRTFEGAVQLVPPSGLAIAPHRGRERRPATGLLKPLKADLVMDLDVQGCPFEAGARLEGRLLVSNRSKKRIRGATVSLVAIEVGVAEGERRTDTTEVASGYLRAPDPSAPQQDIAFGIEIKWCPHPYEGRNSRLDLFLVAELDIAMGIDAELTIPLRIE